MANHAAFALVAALETVGDSDEARRLLSALRRIADDTRAAVRMAAAYGAGRLPFLAKNPEVREGAKTIAEGIRLDPNAMVKQQYNQGRHEAETRAKQGSS